jgi:hypothetical protein
MPHTDTTLRDLHREIIIRLACALNNLRLFAVGAPFPSDLARLAQVDVETAMSAAREAEVVRARISSQLTGPESPPVRTAEGA